MENTNDNSLNNEQDLLGHPQITTSNNKRKKCIKRYNKLISRDLIKVKKELADSAILATKEKFK